MDNSIELSAFHNETLNFHTYEQVYILPNGITAMASTTTRFGISHKDIIGPSVFYIRTFETF